MTQTSELAKEILKDPITIERTLWENNAQIYHNRYSPEALLIFAGVGRIDRERALAAIRQENAEGTLGHRCASMMLMAGGLRPMLLR